MHISLFNPCYMDAFNPEACMATLGVAAMNERRKCE
jgi:hypothetical protein